MNTQPNIDPLCYWVLLTSTLQFCYTSPSFNAVVPQASRLIGRGFLDYLNHSADPPESIATRLHDSFHDDEDKGDVINLHYATVSAIRHHLQTGQFFVDQPEYTFNTYSMVVSRAGGFILAFMHVKTEFSRDCNFHLYEPLKPGDLTTSVTPYLPSLDPNPPYHVFQILSDDERRPIIFTTPTTTSAGRVTISPTQLAEGTQNPRHSLTNQGVTSCTKRTKLSFIISTFEGQLLSVSCILIRHGNALLAMYRLTPYTAPHQTSLPYEQNSVPPGAYDSQGHTGYRRVSLTSEGYSHSSPVTHSGSMNPVSSPAYGQSYMHSGSSQMHRGSSFDSPYPPTSPDEMRSPMTVSPQSPISARGPQPRGIPMRRHSVVDHALSMSPTSQGSISSRIGSYEERRSGLQGIHSPGSIHSPTQSNFLLDHGRGPGTSQTDSSDLSGNALRGRPAKEPPKGVTCCRSCQTTVTPEWRKGPTGVKDMCNACGLRWNRRVKKFKGEGGDSSFDALNLSIPEGESFLEPQRSGGGSKKGHRKKTAESKGPALTTRPQKQRRHSFVNTLSNESPLSGAVHDIPFTGGDSSHTQQYANHHHPHNPHYAQGNPSNNPRPSLPPLYDDGPATIDTGMHARSQSLTSPLSVTGPPSLDRHQSGSVNQSLKRQSTPESPQVLLHRHTSSSSSSGPPLSASSYRPPQSPANGSHSDRTSIPIQGIATYQHSQEFRHD